MKNSRQLIILILGLLLLIACSSNTRSTQSNVVVDQFSHSHGNRVHSHQNPKQSHFREDKAISINKPQKTVIYVEPSYESDSTGSHRSDGVSVNRASRPKPLTPNKPCEVDSILPNKPIDPNCIRANKPSELNPINLTDPTNPILPNKPNILDPIRPNIPRE